MILDKMYELLLSDIRQKINDDLSKILDERDSQYHHFFKKIELMAQKINDLHLRVNGLSKFDRGNIEQYISDNQRLINSYSEGVHNVYKEFQEFKDEVSQAFNAINVMLPEKNKNAHIDDLVLSLRARNCLLAENICTINDLCNETGRNLLKIPNFGKKCLREVREALATLGLVLADC